MITMGILMLGVLTPSVNAVDDHTIFNNAIKLFPNTNE